MARSSSTRKAAPRKDARSKAPKTRRRSVARPAALRLYDRKRDFAITPEPRGARATAKDETLFVVQKHAARRLHYDFRLALDGTLKSWAVTRGPSLDPKDRRLAVHTEDHPMDYARFEGIIPQGQYGGGTVMVWDLGNWQPIGDPRKGYAKGHLEFELQGKKLKGRWHLVRMHGREENGKENWLLIKANDEYATSDHGDVVLENDRSVLTRRPMEKIAAAADATWQSNRAEASDRKPAAKKAAPRSKPALKTAAEPPPFRLTNPDRVLFKDQGLTKQDLANYYLTIAPHMLPHIADRPLSLVRCPGGTSQKCFYQKHAAAGMSEAIRRIHIKAGEEDYLIVDDVQGLIELVQFGTLEIHPWGSRGADIHRPDRLIFDLDPDPSVAWERVIAAAHEVRGLLDEIGLKSFPKTTGGKGLHVVVPIEPGPEWPAAKDFTRQLAELMATRAPDKYTTNMAKRVRKDRIFIDYLRNDFGATGIAPYSTRAREGAPISVPLAWSEVTPDLDPASFSIEAVVTRVKRQRRDPWAALLTLRQRLKL
jgi:bifunctional non-homologous end joining protein LigD